MLRLIGRYRIEERIGDGAMADVYRAYDPSIDRDLAIKLLKTELRQDPEYAMRFLREAKAAGALSHPSIVTIHDIGEADGHPYIVMELLDGEPLDQALARRGRLAPAEVIAIGRQLADALAYAHKQGVVHRDIKPSNIILLKDGSAKILDFGIARVAEAKQDADSVKTQFGQVVGTPRYMSPEQVLGQPIDGRSDLFSLGAILYEMLTGERAFAGASAGTLAIQIIQEDPRPIPELAPCVGAGLDAIVSRLLAKKPERRFATGAELAKALAREEQSLSAQAADVRARRLPLQLRLTLVMATVTAIALFLAVVAVSDRQYRAMERMALSSGSAIATFVASNAALSAAENAGLSPAEQDWAPVAAFVQGAAGDPNVERLMVVDAAGVIRAAKDPALIGRGYVMPQLSAARRIGKVAAVDDGEDFRFVRPIVYAGREFGFVDVSLSKAELIAATNVARGLMAALSALVLLVVAGASYVGARQLAGPVRRLKAALDEAAQSGGGVQISHSRRDEFGLLFDSFNRFSAKAADASAPWAPNPGDLPEAFRPPALDPSPDLTQIRPAPDLQRTVIRG